MRSKRVFAPIRHKQRFFRQNVAFLWTKKMIFFRSLRKGVPGVYTYFLGCEGFIWVYMIPPTCQIPRRTPLGTLTTLVKICKNRDFLPETPLRQNFLVVENEFGGALHTPKFFWEAMKVQSLPQTFFGHKHHVAWVLEPLDPKIAYFGRKIADCRIFCTPKCALWVRTTPQNFFLP